MNADYEWQRPYVAAVLETDRAKLPQHIAQAHDAIRERMAEITQNPPAAAKELEAIDLALKGLNLLSKETAGPALKSSMKSSSIGVRGSRARI